MDIIALLEVVVAGIMWGSSCLFVSTFNKAGLAPLETATIRNVVSGLVFFVVILITDRRKFKIRIKDLWLPILAGVCMYGTGATYYTAILDTSPAVAVVLLYTAPIMVMIYSVLFLGEKLTWLKGVSAIGTFVGCGLVSGIVGDIKFGVTGVLLALASGVLYAAYSVIIKISTRKGLDVKTTSVYCLITAAVCAIIVASPSRPIGLAISNPIHYIPIMLGLGIITNSLPYFLYSVGMKKLPAGVTSSLGIMEPTMATVFSVIFLDEKLTIYGVIGIVIILLSVVGLGFSSEN